MQTRDVVVVGAGLGGLACAALLARGGRRVTVLERSACPGGLGKTRLHEEFAFNRGAHALYRGGAAEGVLDELGIQLRGHAPSLEGVVERGGQRHRLPTTPWAALTTGLLSIRGRITLARLFGRLATLQVGRGSAAAWIDSATDDPAVRAYLAAMLRLVTYCGDLGAVRADFAVSALRQAVEHGVVYLDGGWQQLVDGLLDVCVGNGVEVRVRAPVEAVDPHGVTLRDGTRFDATNVVLAVPPSVASRWVQVPVLTTARVACLDVALARRPDGPGLAFDLDDPMYLSVHSDTASLGPGALVHTIHYGAPDDARTRLSGLLDRTLPRWREEVVHTQFLPSIAVTQGVIPPGDVNRPDVRTQGIWRVGDAVGGHGGLADAAFGSAREVARAILGAARSRAA